MKTYLKCAISVMLFSSFAACQLTPLGILDNEFNLNRAENTIKTSKNKSIDSLSVFLKNLAPKPEIFVVHYGHKGVVVTIKGTVIHVENAVFVNEKGDIIKDNIRLTIQELHTPSDMLLADKPTNLNKTNGHLESFGEFKITANHDGKPLALQAGSSLTVETEVTNTAKKQFLKMPIWDADTSDVRQQLKGLNHLAEPTSVTQFFSQKRGATWTETPQSARTNTFDRLQFDVVNLSKWKNCDIFRKDTTPKTTVMCHFAKNIAPSVFEGETTNQAAIYFKPLGINALIKFYEPILNAPLNKSGFYSEVNSLPIGTKGTLIAVSFLNGKLYADQKDITINAPLNKEKAAFFSVYPVEINQATFLNNLKNL